VLALRVRWPVSGLWPVVLAGLGGLAFFVAYRLLGGMAAEDRSQIARGMPALERLITYLL
jgi:hypothetical protein